MALLERVSALVRANLNDLIDRAEDPQKMLKQVTLDMQNQLLQVKTQVAIAIADEHLLRKKHKENIDKHAEWMRKAEMAVDKKQDDLARAAIDRAVGYRNMAESYDQEIAHQKSQVENLAAPTMLYDSETELRLGSVVLHVQYFPGHTGGDSIVIVQQEKSAVIFCGDLFWNQTLPNLIDASTLPWIETLSTFTKFAAVSPIQFIPGHGDPGNSSDVAAFRGYLSDLREWVSFAKKDGDTAAALVDAVLPQMKKKYGSWQLFDYFSKRNIADVESELNNTKRIPISQR